MGAVHDTNETLGLDWFESDDVRARLQRNEIRDGFSITGLHWAPAGVLGDKS